MPYQKLTPLLHRSPRPATNLATYRNTGPPTPPPPPPRKPQINSLPGGPQPPPVGSRHHLIEIMFPSPRPKNNKNKTLKKLHLLSLLLLLHSKTLKLLHDTTTRKHCCSPTPPQSRYSPHSSFPFPAIYHAPPNTYVPSHDDIL